MSNTVLEEISNLCTTLSVLPTSQILWVSIPHQQLTVFEDSRISITYPASTSRFGIGNKEGSNKTPLGLHKVCEKIGYGAPSGRIFKDRRDTGQNWNPTSKEENMILSRIFRLSGLEKGKNLGHGIDTCERYIYIHGTNQESQIGTPISHGCICMKNKDIIELFDHVKEGALVYIN